MAYTTAQIDTIVAKLESALGKGYASVTHEGHNLVYRSVQDIERAIVYFKALYNDASDAPITAKPKVRTLYGYTNRGFRNF